MTVRRVVTLVLVLCLAVYAGNLLWRVDWASYGPAEAPTESDSVDGSFFTLRRVRFEQFDALTETPELTWSQNVDVVVEGDVEPEKFWGASLGEKQGRSRPQTDRFRSSIRIDIARRSSLGDGSLVVSRVASRADVDTENRLFWSDRIWIPRVPGQYQVRVVLMTRFRDDNDQKHSDEAIVGSFVLRVLQGEPAHAE